MSARLIEPGLIRILACSVAKLTLAASTPGILFKAISTRPTQEAQVIPPMSRVKNSELVEFIAFMWKIIYLKAEKDH
jgi:hypothetical protein